VNGMEKLLARIKALFAPNPAPTPPEEVEVTATPAAPAPEVPEARPPDPILSIEQTPTAQEAPAVAKEAPARPAEAATAELAPAQESTLDEEPASAEGLTLRLETERGSRSTFQVTKTGATIGRGPESTIQLADLSVSRKHARIAYRQGAYWLSDLGSMGGTWVDGTKLAAPRRVATGQTIDIGVCRLRVVAAAEGEKTGAAKGPSNAA
jgi:pSer/pThr/pTyr-binding forkhead associated (FHA) protein